MDIDYEMTRLRVYVGCGVLDIFDGKDMLGMIMDTWRDSARLELTGHKNNIRKIRY